MPDDDDSDDAIGPAPNPFAASPTGGGEIVMNAADIRVLMQRMTEATQAASSAAQAASYVTAAGSVKPLSLGDLSRIIPKPDPFKATTRDDELAAWPSWAWAVEQYLACLDAAYSTELRDYGKQAEPVNLALASEATRNRARLLYGLLNGLMHEKGKRLLRSVTEQNGYEAWRLLSKDLMPKTRNRLLALLRTINGWPSFDTRQGLAQQLLRLEAAFEEYEQLEPGGLPENHKMAALLSCLSGQLRQHANVNISDDSRYLDLRSLVLRWDGAQTKWQSSVALSYGLHDSSKGLQDAGGPVPMEIDRVGYKGEKGKDKGKGKAKGDKGKSKGGKGYGKPSGKYDNGKGKQGKQQQQQQGNQQQQQKGKGKGECFNCGRKGHLARDCWQPRRSVNQVQGQGEQQQQQQQGNQQQQQQGQRLVSTSAPSEYSSYGGVQSQASTAVRRVSAEPLFFDMSDLELDMCSGVRMVQAVATGVQVFRMDARDDDESLPWCTAPECAETWLCAEVRALRSVPEISVSPTTVIVDSGADISCLPTSFATCGRSARSSQQIALFDAQGGDLKVHQQRIVDFAATDRSGREVVIREKCLITSVTQPLLSLGRLVKRGWFPQRQGEDLLLAHGRTGSELNLSFQGNSLALEACIRKVEFADLDPEQAAVRAVLQATLSEELQAVDYGWQVLQSGHIAWRGRSTMMVDPSMMAGVSWPFRSTLTQRDDSSPWFVIEHCERWDEMEDLEAEVPSGTAVEMVVVLHTEPEALSAAGIDVSDFVIPARPGGDRVDDGGGIGSDLEHDEAVEPLMQDGAAVMQESVEPEVAEHRALPDVEEREEREQPSDTVTVQDVVLSAQSSIHALKAACEHLELKTSGSKTRLFQRIQGYLEKQKIALEQDMATDARSGEERRPNMQVVPRAPSEQERLLHEVTHLPFAAWCPHCISMRAMPDRSEGAQQEPRDVPTISFDFCFTGYDKESGEMKPHIKPSQGESSDDLLCCLIAHDSSTGSVVAIPCQSKSTTRFLGVELMRFIHGLGHSSVELRCDNEPSTTSLQTAVAGARKRLGLRTIVRNPAIDAHASNGAVEKAVDVIRRLANTMMSMVRERVGVDFGVDHPMFAWSFVHAGWTRNRFAAVGGLTAYERATNARYTGRLVPFGEPVFGQISVKKKGNAKWVRCIFLSKTTTNDMYVVSTRAGVRLCRSVRRTTSSWMLDKPLYQGLAGFPWDYSAGAVGTRLVPPARTRRPRLAPTLAPGASDEAASDPPTPVPGDVLSSPVAAAPETSLSESVNWALGCGSS